MKITITLSNDEDLGLIGRLDFRNIEATSRDRDRLVNHLKGVALYVISNFEQVPDRIEFEVLDTCVKTP